jgi:hypothetical protein
VIENYLFVSTVWAFDSYESAFRSWQKGFPFIQAVSSRSFDCQFSKAHSFFVSHVTAVLALESKRLLLSGLCKLALKGIFLSSISVLFAFVAPFSLG